jgi:hypothetical protein
MLLGAYASTSYPRLVDCKPRTAEDRALLNGILGTPAQTIETTSKASPYDGMTAEELRAKLRALPPPG